MSAKRNESETAMATNTIKLPACGLFLGSGVYSHRGTLGMSGKAFTCWSPDYPSSRDVVNLMLKANQGNTLQFWQHDQDLLDLARAAVAQGIYVTCIYSKASPDVSAQLKSLGDLYIGYDFGERYTFGIVDQKLPAGKTPADVTLTDLTEDLMRKVAEHVAERHQAGWGPVMATSSNFFIDYEIAGGADIPVPEDFAFRHLLMASAISRGLYRQFDRPLWGSHLAHEWYSWLPHKNPLKFPLFKMALYLKYLSGAKLILNESGNWALQSCLCPDSPMHTTPRVVGDPPGLGHTGKEFFDRHIDEARKLFCNIDYRSPTAAKYRKEISDFYDFVQAHPAPTGQPESVVALAKGNGDLCVDEFRPAYAIGGAFSVAETNPDWFEGDPERGWDIVKSVFYPRPPVLAPNKNLHLSGAPYGLADVVTFAGDRITADFLKTNYKALIFSGWNTCSPAQYKILVEYVTAGGRLCLAIPHLSTNATRNYRSYGVEELVNQGDFSELCGLKVTARGDRFYWATGTETTPNALGLAVPRRYGILGASLGTLAITDPSRVEVLAADDETFRPVVLRCKSGKGEVFFINTWAYPGAINTDDGPGATEDSKGLMGLLYGYIAKISRGHVWITGPDFVHPDADCEHIAYSYFPDAGTICLQNIDFKNPRRCILHQFGDVDPIELAPAEFRMLNTVILKPGEKLL
jgi:hypothetical protein